MSKIYVIEWWVDYESNFEDQNCHEVLDGLGAFDDVYDAWNACIDVAREDSDKIIEEYPNAKISDFETDYDDLTVRFTVDDHVWREVIYKVTGFEAEYYDRWIDPLTGERQRSVFITFKRDKFQNFGDDEEEAVNTTSTTLETWIVFQYQPSLLDDLLCDCPAQYANNDGIPRFKWDTVTKRLGDLDTSLLHYVKVPENHIVIDFDIPDENGNKSFEKNLEEASKWPPTYAELSKSGAGIHLHYIYNGDVSKLERLFKEHVEIKVFTGNSSLRRKLTMCTNDEIATISSGLPLNGEKAKPMVNMDIVQTPSSFRNDSRNSKASP